VFENHTVSDNILLATKAPREVFATLFGGARAQEQETIERILETTRLTTIATGSAAPSRMGRSNGSRSACCWRKTQASAGRRAGPPA